MRRPKCLPALASRRRRPAATLLHELVRANLETWLATAAERAAPPVGAVDAQAREMAPEAQARGDQRPLDSSEHAGGWSVDASMTIPDWDRHGLERLVRYCARPPLSQERLGRLNEQTLVYSLRRPTVDGRTELKLSPFELLDLLAQLVTPPKLHKHRYCGVLAPNAALREAVTASAGPAGATLQLLKQARASMGLPPAAPSEPDRPSPLANLRRAAARCWALLLVRIYECLPLRCPKCGEPMRIIAYVLDRPQVERILDHIGEPTQPPVVLPARSPPQLEFGFDQTTATDDWPEMDQTAVQGADGWECSSDRRTGAGRRIGGAADGGVRTRRGGIGAQVGDRGGLTGFRGIGGGYSGVPGDCRGCLARGLAC